MFSVSKAIKKYYDYKCGIMNKQKKGEDLELKYLRLKYLSEEELSILASIRHYAYPAEPQEAV